MDLRRADDHELLRAVQGLADLPAGVDVVLVVAAGSYAPQHGVQYVRAEGDLGTVTVESSDPATVRRWVRSLRGQEPSW